MVRYWYSATFVYFLTLAILPRMQLSCSLYYLSMIFYKPCCGGSEISFISEWFLFGESLYLRTEMMDYLLNKLIVGGVLYVATISASNWLEVCLAPT